MAAAAGIAYLAIFLYMLVLGARLVIEWIRSFAPVYRPRGIVLVIFEVIYTLTDPPLRLLRRVIPPLRIGAALLDLSPMVLLIVGWLLMRILARLIIAS